MRGLASRCCIPRTAGEELPKGSIPGLLAAIDFGTGDLEHEVPLLQTFQPDAPTFIAEYWDGWFDHWGEKHQVTDAAVQEKEIRSGDREGVFDQPVHGGRRDEFRVDERSEFGWG